MYSSVELNRDVLLDRPPNRAEPYSCASGPLASVASAPESNRWTMQTDGLRPIVEALDREMSRLVARGNVGGADTSALLASWAKLVEFLALGPAPELRECPYCGSIGMRPARLCGNCCRKLEPAAPLATA
jgi:hypothetical protein